MKTPSKRLKANEFSALLKKYFISDEIAGKIFHVTPRTIRNWKRKQPNPAASALIRAIYARDLAAVHPAWKGFSIGLNGKLY